MHDLVEFWCKAISFGDDAAAPDFCDFWRLYLPAQKYEESRSCPVNWNNGGSQRLAVSFATKNMISGRFV